MVIDPITIPTNPTIIAKKSEQLSLVLHQQNNHQVGIVEIEAMSGSFNNLENIS